MKKRYIILLAVILITLFAGRYEWRARHGYCFAESRYLSSSELTNSAMMHAYRRFNNGDVDRLVLDEGEKFIIYKTFDEFKQANPYCCKQIYGQNWKSRRVKLDYGSHVYKTYVHFRFKERGDNAFARAGVRMNNCGKSALVTTYLSNRERPSR